VREGGEYIGPPRRAARPVRARQSRGMHDVVCSTWGRTGRLPASKPASGAASARRFFRRPQVPQAPGDRKSGVFTRPTRPAETAAQGEGVASGVSVTSLRPNCCSSDSMRLSSASTRSESHAAHGTAETWSCLPPKLSDRHPAARHGRALERTTLATCDTRDMIDDPAGCRQTTWHARTGHA
jgi:hypothetical protein